MASLDRSVRPRSSHDRSDHRARVLARALAAVARKPEAELGAALDRLVEVGLLFRQGVAAESDVSVQARACTGRGVRHAAARARRGLHARITENLETQFAEMARISPNCGKSLRPRPAYREGGNPLEQGRTTLPSRSALARSPEQLPRAIDQIATLPPRPRSVANRSHFKSR